jgi:hypothetical protein
VAATRVARPQLSFPFIGGEAAWPADAQLRLADGDARLGPAGEPDAVVLAWRGTDYTVDAALEAPLRALVAGEAVAYAAFEASVPEDLRGHVAGFVSLMVRRGVLLVGAEAAS